MVMWSEGGGAEDFSALAAGVLAFILRCL